MDINIVSYLKDIIGIVPGSQLDQIVDGIIDKVPYALKIRSAVIMNRLQTRLKNCENQLRTIQQLVNQIDDGDYNNFIQNLVFPLVFEDLLNELQDEKVELLLNGFEVTLRNRIRDEDKIVSYYDVLRELRVEDIKELLTYTSEYKKFRGELLAQNDMLFRPNIPKTQEELIEWNQNKGHKSYITNKLEKLGLLDLHKVNDIEEVFKELNNALKRGNVLGTWIHKKNPSITVFGKSFISFYNLTNSINYNDFIP